MPNPFVRSGQMRMSEKPPNTEPIQPIIDSIEGDILPGGRGFAYHGVAPTERPEPPEGYSDIVEIEYEEPPESPSVVPVRIVNESARQQRHFRTTTIVLNPAGPPKMILGEDPTRTRAVVKNVSTDDAWIGSTQQQAGSMFGYPLSENETETLSTDQEVYAQSSHASNTVTLCILSEYTINVD